MYIVCVIGMFIIGTIFGSFFNVVGYRLPKGESIITPPSHCPNCKHKLKWYELFPIFSFLFLRGKCHKCHKKISWFYPIFETICGILFALSFISFEFDPKIIIALTFISMLIIVVVSDYHYMIIPDEVLIFFGISLMVEIGIISGFYELLVAIGHGLLAFFTMWGIKLLGDFMFKKESMGGGDIKLMFIFGLVLTYPLTIVAICLGSFIALPISLILIRKKTNHEIPFGPFLALGSVIVLLTQIDFETVTNTINNLF